MIHPLANNSYEMLSFLCKIRENSECRLPKKLHGAIKILIASGYILSGHIFQW